MSAQSGFTKLIRSFAFLSALFLLLASAAPSAMAREGFQGAQIAAQEDAEPGCD